MTKKPDPASTIRLSYTKHEDPIFDLTIGHQLAELTNRIVSEVRDLVALFLIGGYARGEGSALLENGKVIPLGDYDFLAVTGLPHLNSHFPWLETMGREFRVQYHIGVDTIWKPLLPFLGKRIYWYEAKFGGRRLFGDEHALDVIPVSEGGEIDLTEGPSLMFNRLMGLLLVFDPELVKSSMCREEQQHLIFQSVKVILSCGESLLLLAHKYHFSYEERSRRLSKILDNHFDEMLKADPSIKDDYQKATLFKLSPDFEMYRDPVRLWFTARQHAVETLLFYVKKTNPETNASKAGYDDFPNLPLSINKPQVLDFVKFNWNAIRHLRSLKGLKNVGTSYSDVVRTSIYYLALSISETGDICEESLDKAMRQIECVLPTRQCISQETNLQKKWRYVRNAVHLAWTLARQ